MKQVGIVPRIGTSLIQIVCTFEKVICVTSTNSLKISTTHLEDVSVITGLAKCKQTADEYFTKNSQKLCGCFGQWSTTATIF